MVHVKKMKTHLTSPL